LRLLHKKIGLVLGSGGARGWSHLGVIEALRELEIPIECVAGTSMGALVGSALASDRIDALREVSLEMDWRHFIYYFMEMGFPKAGLIDGDRIVKFLKENIGSAHIEDLPLPFAAVATDINSGEEIVFKKGSLSDAVRASIAIPGIFTPLVTGDHVLVDGGLVNPLPVSVARAMGANTVIAVDVLRPPQSRATHGQSGQDPNRRTASISSSTSDWLKRINEKIQALDLPALPEIRHKPRHELPGVFDVLGNSIRIVEQQITRTRLKLEPPDILIQPAVQDISTMEFHKAPEAVDAGYAAAMEGLKDLRR